MPKYFDTKKGSLESAVFEAVSPAQQAAIAISKKEKGEKPKNEKDENNYIHAAKMAKEKGEKTFTIGGKTYDTKTEQEIKEETLDENQYYEYKFKNKNDAMAAKKMLDAVQLMDFDINDDDISNGELVVSGGMDGDEDFTKYHKEILKKFRQVKVLTTEKLVGGQKKLDKDKDGDIDGKDFAMLRKSKSKSKSEAFEYGTPEATENSLNMTPGQSTADWNETVGVIQKKNDTMREALAKMWGVEEGNNPFRKEEKIPKGYHRMPDGSLMKDSDMDKKENKTMTGKPMTKVDVDPDVKEKRQR